MDLALAADPVGLHLAMGYGTSLEVVHAAEVRGVAVHPDVWRHLRALIDTVAVWRATPARPRYLITEPGVGYRLCEEG